MKFSDGRFSANAKTVGELVAPLQQLPDELPIEQGFSDGVDVVIFNSNSDEPHIGFEDGLSWTDDK